MSRVLYRSPDEALEAEALRYMGHRGALDAQVLERVRRAAHEARAVVRFKSAVRVCALNVGETGIVLEDLPIQSATLAKRFSGAESAIALAGTLGVAADSLIRKHAALGMAHAAAAQAVCTALLEQELDALMDETARAHPAMRLTPRMSPGYGDFDLRHQRALLNLLDAGRRLGVTVNEAHMMMPLKTVTAVSALVPDTGAPDAGCAPDASCALCPKRDCVFRKGI